MRSRANSACGARGPTRTPPARAECGRAVHRLATAVPTCQAGVMCARYGIFSATAAVAEAFAARLAPEAMRLKPSGTIAPGADVAVVVRRPESADGSGTGGPAPFGRRVHAARWGLLPPWARDPAAAFHAFNARCETAAVKPTFRDAMRSFRVVVPASCWYEWRAQTPSAAQAGGPPSSPTPCVAPTAEETVCSRSRACARGGASPGGRGMRRCTTGRLCTTHGC